MRSRGLVVALVLVAMPARADVVARCIAHSEAGQVAQRRGGLTEAKTELLACAQNGCPRLVQQSCTRWLAEVERQLPTVVFAVVDEDGRDLTDAKLEVDDASAEPGRAVPLDPGSHRVVVTAPGRRRAESALVAREGEKARLHKVQLEALPGPRVVGPPPPAPAEKRPISTWTWVTGGAAVVGLGVFTGFAIAGRSEAQDLRATCAPDCTGAQRDSAKAKYVVADVGLVAAIVLAGISVATYVFR